MAYKKYVVELTMSERELLLCKISKGKLSATANRKARILLKTDKGPHGEGWTDRRIWKSLETSPSTVARVRETFVMEGMDAVFTRKRQAHPSVKRIFDGEAEAKLIALACSQPPKGYARWTIRLLAEKVIELNIVDKAHFNTVGRTLKKMNLNLTASRYWVIPPKENAAFVAASPVIMENVLAVYQRPKTKAPLVCLDEAAKQLVSATRLPIPMVPGRTTRHDYEYKRAGTANLFMAFAPLEGLRHVHITSHRGRVDYARFLADLSDTYFPDAEKIVLVQDNLNTHTPASLYATFPPKEARRIADRFEWNYTPKHGSWLNMAEAELSVLSRQCLGERIASREELEKSVTAWTKARNNKRAIANWQFTNKDARTKLRKLYPSV